MAITNAQIAQEISNLVDYWRTRDVEFAEWLSGAADGGPYGDGRFPLSDYLGVTQYLYSPAALQGGVSDSASAAAVQAALAVAAQDAASAAQAAAEGARNLALTYATAAQSARDLASMYADNSANSAANALVHRNAAAASATAAAGSVTSADTAASAASTSAGNAAGSASAAAGSAAAAAVSAAAAAAFDPTGFATLAGQPTFAGHIAIKGSATGASNLAYLELFDSANTRTGWLGDGNGLTDIFLAAESSGANVQLVAGAGGSVIVTGAALLPSGAVNLGSSTSRFQDLYVAGGVRDAGANGYMLNSSGTVLQHGAGSLWTAQRFFAGGSVLLSLTPSGSVDATGKIQTTGWSGDYSSVLGLQLGITGGQAYVHCYNGGDGTYGVLNLAGSKINLLAQTTIASAGVTPILQLIAPTSGPWAIDLYRADLGQSSRVYNSTGTTWAFEHAPTVPGIKMGATGYLQTSNGDYFQANGTSYWASYSPNGMQFYNRASALQGYIFFDAASFGLYSGSRGFMCTDTLDGYLRLNHTSGFSNGVYTPGAFRATGTITADGAITAGTVYSTGFYYAADPNYYLFNTAGYSYGSWRVGGARNGYNGVMLDTTGQPTFMAASSGGAIGVYLQASGYGYWSWLDNGATFAIQFPIVTSGGAAYIRHNSNAMTSGRVFVQNGGSAAGTAEGDITLIW